jgi:serine/threonine protein kinase
VCVAAQPSVGGAKMNQERWRNLQELYEAASHSSGNGRLAILRTANLDPETENELRSMLDHSLEDDLFGDWASAGAAQLLITERELKVGHRLGPYTIEGTLGRGGMGQVYRALDNRLHRRVAIKLLHGAALMDSASRERFLAEANVIAGLNHPNICTLHDIGSENGFDFLVMELVEGRTLRERLEKGPLPLGEVLEIGAALAAALGHAHGRGIIHRDVKPENVILARSGPKLLDFGIALALVEVNPSQTPAGTPAMRPLSNRSATNRSATVMRARTSSAFPQLSMRWPPVVPHFRTAWEVRTKRLISACRQKPARNRPPRD